MKFVTSESLVKIDIPENDWIEIEGVDNKKQLFYGIILGVLLTALLSGLINNLTLCSDIDFFVYKKIYLILIVIPLHELTHLLFFPNPKNTVAGFSLKKMIFFVTTPEILSKKRFMVTTIMPCILLTCIPFFLLFFLNNQILAYIALYNLLGSGIDIISFFQIKKYPKYSHFRFYDSKTFYKIITK